MKSRVLTNQKQVKQLAEQEYLRLKDTVYDNVIRDVIPQFLSVCMVILNRENNFGEKRLRRFVESVMSEFTLMNRGVLGREYDPLQCIDYLKDKYGIDVDEEIKKIQT